MNSMTNRLSMKNEDFQYLQMERLNPVQLDKALEKKSLVYLPLGALEWHGLHLPIGLDSLTSHGICLRAANTTGGLVMPPLYFGMTGSIWHHPHTILIEEDGVLLSILETTLKRFEAIGIQRVLIFTGHFAVRQLEMLETLSEKWKTEKKLLDLSILSISDCPTVEMDADHGAIFETSVLAQIHPELVKLHNLPDMEKVPANDPNGNSKGDHRRNPKNVLYGVFGDDPRGYSEKEAERILCKIVDWVVNSVRAE